MKLNKKYIILLILVILAFCTWEFRWYGRIGFSTPKWTDSIKINGIKYDGEYNDDIRQEIDSGEIGETYSKINFKLSGNIRNSIYRMRNNDATLLDKGTVIYTIKEQQPEEKVAAKIGDKYYIFNKSNFK